MAVEARHINLFPSQILNDRANLVNAGIHSNAQMDYSALPLPASAMVESLLPFYQSTLCDPISAKTSMNKADSGLTYNLPASRKRSRDFITESNVPHKNKLSSASLLLEPDILHQIQNHQSEIDLFIALHTDKVRMELEEQRTRQLRKLHSAIQEVMMKKLKEKDEEIQKMGKLNWVLQERVKSLCVENQIWKELAQTNEATANSLRSNLEQVLAAHVSEDRHTAAGGGSPAVAKQAVADDAESSCGSNDEARCMAETGEVTAAMGGGGSCERLCTKCGLRESIVLLLPCRHLCLCTTCGSASRDCPVCHSGINASVHVNFS